MTKKAFNAQDLREDFMYHGVEYESDYDRPRSCSCDSIHRCSRITNAKVTDVNLNRIVDKLFARTEEHKDAVLMYCVHRVLSHSPVRKTDSWAVSVGKGYYGEEVDSVRLDQDIADNAIRTIKELLKLPTDLKRVKFVLEYEYDYLLDSLKDTKKCYVETVKLDQVFIPQQEHYRKLDKDVVVKYSDYTLPTCICLKAGDKFRLIDGHHRLRAAHKGSAKNIEVIVLE